MALDAGLGKRIAGEHRISMLLLGLCPAVAVSVRVIDALWMSAGVFSVALLAALCGALVRRWGRSGEGAAAGATVGKWMGALALSSCLTACFEVVLLAVAPEASASLGIYAPLIAVNCLVLGSAGTGARDSSITRAVLDAAEQGLGFSACLLLIALLRESLGAGTITLFAVDGFNGVIAIPSLARDPARALGASGAGLLCLGYLGASARLLRWRGEGREKELSP